MDFKPFLERVPVLVFGLSGQIGSGISFVRDKLAQSVSTYGYEPVPIVVSSVILNKLFDTLDLVAEGESDKSVLSEPIRRVRRLQCRGNILREQFGNEAIASLALSHVIYPWFEKNGWQKRVAFMVDSLKHPDEIHFLREVFGKAFYAIGVVTSDSVRMDRLISQKDYSEKDFHTISKIDADENEMFGQKAVKTITESDYFIANDFSTKASLTTEIQRLLRLAFSISVETPRQDEYGMNLAARSALRSGCLSRRVGSAIVSAKGDVLATGRNDVPQFGGGLYTSESKHDQRCWTKAARCYNSLHKKRLIDELLKIFQDCIQFDSNVEDEIRSKLVASGIRDLIEFSRAVHAEMDAIISVARQGHSGLVGSTLYCSTYPCHSCARHIIDAGIVRVVYLEPYEKSLARTLHSDAICDPLRGKEANKIPFELYGGAAPRRYDQFFGYPKDRKDSDGRAINRDKNRMEIMPIGALSLEELTARLKKVIEEHGIKV